MFMAMQFPGNKSPRRAQDYPLLSIALAVLVLLMLLGLEDAVAAPQFPAVPDRAYAKATLDLTTAQDADVVKGQWRYHDARIIEVPFRAADADGQPTGHKVRTNTLEPLAGGADFDDSQWPVIAANGIDQRRGNGLVSFNWYRIRLTVPARVGNFDPTGATLVFETELDDYAEVWVDGELPRVKAQSGGSVIKGWNAPNRLIIGRNVQPGQQIQLAIFGINGPISAPPTNFIYIRHARLEFHASKDRGPLALPAHEVNIDVLRKDERIHAIVPANAKLFKLAEGFQFTEGPVWVHDNSPSRGHLLFSDPNANLIYKYQPDVALTVFRRNAGYAGRDIGEYRQPGSNGLTLDRQGRLTINEHGNRRVIRLDKDGGSTVLADRFDGKRLNSPNDLVYHSSGAIYFTDPFFGLPRLDADPRKELPFQGVYRAHKGKVLLLTKELKGPNGIAFSPDEKFLYVGNWDDQHKVVMRYPVNDDGTLGKGRLFFDMTDAKGEDAIDGVKVDQAGNVYVSGPGGLWILSPDGDHLGTILTPFHAHNFAWGDADGKTLYLCARSRLYRMRLHIAGVRP